MTKQERIIISAYTGYLMCDETDVLSYIRAKLGKPVWSYELNYLTVRKEIQEKCESDFLALCEI